MTLSRTSRPNLSQSLLLGSLLAVSACGDAPGLLTYFTSLAYLADGSALLLEASDGVYLAVPPDATPRRLGDAETACEGKASYSLGCARLSPRSDRLALLRNPVEAGALTTWNLWLFSVEEGAAGTRVATSVLDAAFSPDGGELVWVGPTASGSVGLFRWRDGEADLLIERLEWRSADDLASMLSAIFLTSRGVAYGRTGLFGLELWFQPFDGGAPDELGRLSAACAGASLARCLRLSPDGVTLAWQESGSGVIQLYRSDLGALLPLGAGASFRFSRAGAFVLRIDGGTAYVQRSDTAAVVRGVGAATAELSGDGELLAFTQADLTADESLRLWVGPTRRNGADFDYGLFSPPEVQPLMGAGAGGGALQHAFTGDGRFVITALRPEAEAAEAAEPEVPANSPPEEERAPKATLVALHVNTSERRVLDELECPRCCSVPAVGALVLCQPTDATDAASALQGVPLDLYDPATGLRTRASDRALSAAVTRDGTAVALLEAVDGSFELKVVTKEGARFSLGTSYRFVLSPLGDEIARVDKWGKVSVEKLP